MAVPLTTPPPPQHQHNGAIITAVTLRLGQTAHLYLGIYVTYSRPINLPDMSSNEGSGVGGGGGGIGKHTCRVYVFRWGDGEHLAQVASRRL